VALRNGGALYWLLGDHLGSTAYTVSGASESGEMRYKAFGATRFTSGATLTTFRYTGQREEAGLGLYYYAPRDSLIVVKGENLKIMSEWASDSGGKGWIPGGSGGKDDPGPGEQFA
jgi:hypothetical protein